MIIQSDTIGLNSRRSYEESMVRQSSATSWNNAIGRTFSANSSEGYYYREDEKNGAATTDYDGSGSDAKKQDPLENILTQFDKTKSIHGDLIQDRMKSIDEIRRQSIDYLIYLLFGKKTPAPDFSSLTDASQGTSSGQTATGTGGQYYSSYYYSEHETTKFDAKGTVVTADGREINFNINLTMSRSFTQSTSTMVNYGEPNLCDPLVINLNSNIASVSDQNFFFDLDCDGTSESISVLNPGSGYLALDKNNDGIINDGSELFGTSSGNGFADLAAYDSDKNGWIDEADEIFDKLKIWTTDEKGNSTLCGLAKAGVGAIYLGSSGTNFSIKSATNETSAVIRQTGMFLYENGGCGTIQQLDLAT